jgi:hypothetical protein
MRTNKTVNEVLKNHTKKPRTGLLLFKRQSLRRLTSPAKMGVLAEVPAETVTLPPITTRMREPEV